MALEGPLGFTAFQLRSCLYVHIALPYGGPFPHQARESSVGCHT